MRNRFDHILREYIIVFLNSLLYLCMKKRQFKVFSNNNYAILHKKLHNSILFN